MNLSTKAATLLVIAVLGQALSGQNVADITDEPYHTLLVQNQWVRAFRIEIPPFKSTPVFKQEHDYVVITLTDSAIKQNKPGEAPIAFPRYAGDIRYIHGGIAHAMMNDETSTYRNVTVEISTPDSSKYVGYITDDAIRDVLGPGADPHAKYVVTLDKTGVKILNVRLLPGDSMDRLQHRGPGELIVAVSDVSLRSGADTLDLKQGEAQWLDRGTYTLTNVGREPAQVVVFEPK